MNPERLLALFDRVSEAPDAVAKLRRFVLDLAVRGKLVEQDPADEPAKEQLKRIAVAKLANGRAERARARPTPRGEADLAVGRGAPAGWSIAPLADLVVVLNGRAYSKNELLEAGTPVLRVGNLFTSKHWYYSNLDLEADKYCDAGDLIFAWSASFGPFIWPGPKVIYHYHIWKLAPHSEVDTDKLFLNLVLRQMTQEIKDAGHGISMVHMTKEKMEQIPVPVPPLAEQRRIVARVDELMALCDQLEAARTDREHRRDRLAAATLSQLNTPDQDAFLTAAQAGFALAQFGVLAGRPGKLGLMREAIVNLAAAGRLSGGSPDAESKLPGQQTDWRKVQMRDVLAELQTGPFGSSLHQSDYVAGGIPVINPASIQNGRIVPIEKMAIGAFTLERLASFKLRTDDIVMARRGEMGRCAVVTTVEDGWLCGTGSLILRPAPCVWPRFLALVIGSPSGRAYLGGAAVGTTMQNLNQSILMGLEFWLPPLAEQRRIVARVDELMALCDQLEASLAAADTANARLLDAILHEALNGPARALETEAA